MAPTPIGELIATIELVRSMKVTLDGLVTVVEKMGGRLEQLERRLAVPSIPPPPS